MGDPCYAIPNDEWSEWCDLTDIYKPDADGGHGFKFHEEDVWYSNTRWGDGSYYDQDDRGYDVDSGTIGVVPVCLIVPEPGAEAVEPGGMKVDGGHIMDFDEDFEVSANTVVKKGGDGIIRIGHLRIDTDPPAEEEEDDYWIDEAEGYEAYGDED